LEPDVTFLIDSLGPDPMPELSRWLAEAEAAGCPEPSAVTLATATPDGQPSARMMLCKEVTPIGVRLYTNYTSRKAAEMDANPRAALVFHWPTLGRQIRLEGRLARTSRAVSEEYFASRPRGSQLGAWASAQSQPLSGYAELAEALSRIEARFSAVVPVPCPPHWGGYELTVIRAEFWLGQLSRLHDRVAFELSKGTWKKTQLAP
jgi:pyridoxamine 5'-phosphate oxidase